MIPADDVSALCTQFAPRFRVLLQRPLIVIARLPRRCGTLGLCSRILRGEAYTACSVHTVQRRLVLARPDCPIVRPVLNSGSLQKGFVASREVT